MARRKQETEKLHFLDLPDEASPDYFRIIVRNCITAYSKLLNDKLALDCCKVLDRKLRTMVIADNEYQRETRSIYAQRMWEEVEEIERLVTLADGMGGDDEEDEDDVDRVDVRNRGKQQKPKKVTTADKDMLNMRFKALQARRDMLNLSADNEQAEEIDALNIMYVPLTQEEFERMKTADIFKGTDDADSTFDTSGSASKTAPEAYNRKADTSVEELYTVDANGDIVEL
jgi:hypothetical protein